MMKYIKLFEEIDIDWDDIDEEEYDDINPLDIDFNKQYLRIRLIEDKILYYNNINEWNITPRKDIIDVYKLGRFNYRENENEDKSSRYTYQYKKYGGNYYIPFDAAEIVEVVNK